MNILVVAPHPDDEAIGCGGSICLHTAKGDRVVVVFLTSGELGLKHLAEAEARRTREAEAACAARVLAVSEVRFSRLPDWGCEDALEQGAEVIAGLLAAERPGIVYLPHPVDDHPDHRACLPMIRRALAIGPEPDVELRGYEVWTPLSGFDVVEDISAVMQAKLAAIRAYDSQLEQFRYDRAVEGLNQYRGALAGRCEFAEVFSLLEPVEPG